MVYRFSCAREFLSNMNTTAAPPKGAAVALLRIVCAAAESAGYLAFLAAEQIDHRCAEDHRGGTDAPEFGGLAAHFRAGADTDETGEIQKQQHTGHGSDHHEPLIFLLCQQSHDRSGNNHNRNGPGRR